MPNIRVRPETGTLFLDFRYRGARCREQTLLADTPANRLRLKRLSDRIDRALSQGTFRYADFFPGSPRAAEFGEAAATPETPQGASAAAEPLAPEYPQFSEFSALWYAENEPRWRTRYREFIRETLDQFILPVFGHLRLDKISRADLLAFRAETAKRRGRVGATIGPDRINKLMRITTAILEEGCDRFGLNSPARGIKALKQRRPEVQPFTLAEVNQILEKVRPDFRPYLTVRMFTGLRTGEVNGLQWGDIDWEAGTLHVQRTTGRGGDGETKTDASNRFIPLVPQVRAALEAQRANARPDTPWVFHGPRGGPLDEVNFTNRVWYPLLRHLGLKRRRPYQMRHTAATLMLAAGENPEWIARTLGHTTTEMLFRTYSRYVPNLTRNDGRAFVGLLSSQAATPSHPQPADPSIAAALLNALDHATKARLLAELTKELNHKENTP